MTIEKKSENNSVILSVCGELTALTVNQLSVAVKAVIPETDHLVLDFKNVEYVASAGLRVLLEAKKLLDAKEGKFIVRNTSEAVMHIFEITGFSDMLNLE